MNLPASPKGCPMDTILRLLMGPWTTYILYVLRTQGPTRFGALKRQVGGVSAKMLTERLRLLEAAEVVRREYVPTIPPQVTYSLAPRGRELAGVIDQLDKIAQRWAVEEAARPADAETRARPKRAAG
jgi:DNA-binding HxlR family transcriptional regulator